MTATNQSSIPEEATSKMTATNQSSIPEDRQPHQTTTQNGCESGDHSITEYHAYAHTAAEQSVTPDTVMKDISVTQDTVMQDISLQQHAAAKSSDTCDKTQIQNRQSLTDADLKNDYHRYIQRAIRSVTKVGAGFVHSGTVPFEGCRLLPWVSVKKIGRLALPVCVSQEGLYIHV
jgi:hypothetical protein